MPKRKNEKVLRALRPSVGLAAEYRRRLDALISEMATSVEHWIGAAYRREEPHIRSIAQDAEPPPQIAATWVGGARPWTATIDGEPLKTSKGATIRFGSSEAAVWAARRFAGDLLPADQLQAAMTDLGDYWLSRFDDAAPRLGEWFSKSVSRRSDVQLRNILSDGGLSVRFQMTPAMSDVLQATVGQNVSLIKSISEQYLKNVEGSVMRSVQRGRDLGYLSKELTQHYGVTKRRAAFIAQSQNNLATGAMHRARQTALGITEGLWLHSHGGRVPRKTHLANDGKRFNIALGWYDPDPKVQKRILPGELPRCRCVWKPIIPGL